MDKEKRHHSSIESFEETYSQTSIDGLFVCLNNFIDKSNELSNCGINNDEQLFSHIKYIIQILYIKHNIPKNKIKDQKYLSFLIEKYSDLNNAWDRADDTGGHGKDRILYEMQETEKNLNKFGLDNEGNLLKSLGDLQKSVKETVKNRLDK
ncbi:MAG: hypothetical protein PHZ26_04780 [Candidatus Gracilibacteria bacterium]|nr:hypothetical protein [Candidatus Gracilibacteria bacterium]MDD2909043.1 hypothetical protein [Candidatus Gracilibacteria bacterium]